MESAKGVIRLAIETFKVRKASGAPVPIPNYKSKTMAGFSLEAMLDLFAAINPDKPDQGPDRRHRQRRDCRRRLLAGCNNLAVDARPAPHRDDQGPGRQERCSS